MREGRRCCKERAEQSSLRRSCRTCKEFGGLAWTWIPLLRGSENSLQKTSLRKTHPKSPVARSNSEKIDLLDPKTQGLDHVRSVEQGVPVARSNSEKIDLVDPKTQGLPPHPPNPAGPPPPPPTPPPPPRPSPPPPPPSPPPDHVGSVEQGVYKTQGLDITDDDTQ